MQDWEIKGNRLKDLEQFRKEAVILSKQKFGDINDNNCD